MFYNLCRRLEASWNRTWTWMDTTSCAWARVEQRLLKYTPPCHSLLPLLLSFPPSLSSLFHSTLHHPTHTY